MATQETDVQEAITLQVRAGIESLVELESRREAMIAPLAEQVALLQAQMDEITESIDMEIAHVKALAEDYVLSVGHSITDMAYQVIYCKGRETWDTKRLDGYALAHPELLELKKVGEPYVQWRNSRKGK